MTPIFVQRYKVQQDIPIISVSSSGKPTQTGKVSQGEVVRGIVKNINVVTGKRKKELEMLQIASNKYIVPKYVVIEPLSGADGEMNVSIENDSKPGLILTLLPIAGLAMGIWFAHRNRDFGSTANKTIAYVGYGALGLFLGSMPILIWKYNKTQRDFDKKTSDAANGQKDKELADKAYTLINTLAKKADKVIVIDKDEFNAQFAQLNTKEKEAFVYIAEETVKLPVKDSKKYDMGVEAISRNATSKFGAEVIQSLADKTSLPA